MQFEMNYEAGKDFTKVTFTADLFKMKQSIIEILRTTFERIGAIDNKNGTFMFPVFIDSSVIKTIIRNTCFVCGGLMKDDNKLSLPFINSNQCSVKLFKDNKVRKCVQCGHSHT